MAEKTKIIFKSVILTSIAMIVYFFLLRGLNIDKMPSLRLINFLFIFLGANYTIEKNIKINKETQYYKNFIAGMYSSLLTIAIALSILVIYVNYIQPSFIKILQNNFFFWNHDFSFPMIIFIIFIQGIIVSLVSTFIAMLYWKKHS